MELGYQTGQSEPSSCRYDLKDNRKPRFYQDHQLNIDGWSTLLELSANPNYSGDVLKAEVTVQTASGAEKEVIKLLLKLNLK